MKNYLWLNILLILVYTGCSKEDVLKGELIVECYLYANNYFDTLRIAEVQYTDFPTLPEPVIGAEVYLTVFDKQIRLTDLDGHPGIYYSADTVLMIHPNTRYNLKVENKSHYLIAETLIPAGSSNPHLSNDTIIYQDILIITDMQKTSSILSWNPGTNYSHIFSVISTF